MQAEQYLILANDDQYHDYQCIVDRQVNDSSFSYNSATKSKIIPATHNNANQQLQDLLQSDTVNYSQFSTQKKRLFPYDISFFSRDHTQDLTNQQGYNQLVGKIHFERSRNRQLVNELVKQKQRIIEKYLGEIMEEFRDMSEENQRLRQVYKKQAGGGYKQQSQGKQLVRNNSGKQQEMKKSSQQGSQSQLSSNQTPRNSNKSRVVVNRNSIATTSLLMGSNQQQQLVYSNGNNGRSGVMGYGNNNSSRVFYGVGGGNFYQPQKLETLRSNQTNTNSNNKLINCDSSTSIIHHNSKPLNNNNTIFAITQRSQHQHQPTLTQSQSKIHNRRQSQFTQRKNYPTVITNNKENYNQEFLMLCDDQGELSFYNYQRMSQPGKMIKREKVSEVVGKGLGWNDGGKETKKSLCDANQSTLRRVNQSTERASFKFSLNQEAFDNNNFPTNTKNIFIEFLETILLQEYLSSQALTENIQKTTAQQERQIFIPSFHNIRYIEQLQKQITNKNIKLRQLQEVINAFKLEIEQIMGTDVKIVNQLMVELLQVKGKYLEMQGKIDNIARLKEEIQGKEVAKQRILAKVKLQIQKQSHENKSQTLNNQKDNNCPNVFSIPQSIQTLFSLLNISIAKNSKPMEYLNKIKQVPKNKDLFQVFDSKKRLSYNVKIKQVIGQIKEGRRKFNEVIKIYESRIVKLQEKIQRYKSQMGCAINQERKHGNIEK